MAVTAIGRIWNSPVWNRECQWMEVRPAVVPSSLATVDTFATAGNQKAVIEPPRPLPPLNLTAEELQARLTGSVRIGILVERPLLTISTNVPGAIFDGDTRLVDLEPATLFKTRFEEGKIRLYSPDGKLLGTFPGPLTVRPVPGAATGGVPAAVAVDGRSFRGQLEILIDPQSGIGLNAVNRVSLEEYLYGVVPAEMPSSWHSEALKAQAVAARTYAIANLGRRGNRGFDLYATTADQVYQGIAGEVPASTGAVDETQGVIITYGGQPINALFHANAGGHTEDVRDVWGFDLPYIKGVPDFDQAAPRYRWAQTFDAARIAAVVRQLGTNIGAVRSLEPVVLTPHGRVSRLRVVGTAGTIVVDGNQFRLALGLYSTLYRVTPVESKHRSRGPRGQSLPASFRFDGGGWGHGLGMSQYGARQLAENGMRFDEILKYYYSGVEIT